MPNDSGYPAAVARADDLISQGHMHEGLRVMFDYGRECGRAEGALLAALGLRSTPRGPVVRDEALQRAYLAAYQAVGLTGTEAACQRYANAVDAAVARLTLDGWATAPAATPEPVAEPVTDHGRGADAGPAIIDETHHWSKCKHCDQPIAPRTINDVDSWTHVSSALGTWHTAEPRDKPTGGTRWVGILGSRSIAPLCKHCDQPIVHDADGWGHVNSLTPRHTAEPRES